MRQARCWAATQTCLKDLLHGTSLGMLGMLLPKHEYIADLYSKCCIEYVQWWAAASCHLRNSHGSRL